MKILIAYDRSECSAAALKELHRAGLPREADACLVSVEEFVPVLTLPEGTAFSDQSALLAGLLGERKETAREAAARLQDAFPDWRVTAEAGAGSPASVLLRKAEEWQPDLIVAGSHGRSAFARALLGSVSQKLVTEAHSSVRIARAPLRNASAPVRLILGIDGSPGADAAVRAVAARVWPTGSEARLLAVIDETVAETLKFTEAIPYEGHSWLIDTLEEAEKILLAARLRVSSHVIKGEPKRLLPQEADDWGADCVFVGARSLSRLERFRLGSVSAAVAARAHCSVEIVR